jgi:hypothetical protein
MTFNHPSQLQRKTRFLKKICKQVWLILLMFYAPQGNADEIVRQENGTKKWTLFSDVLFWNLEETCSQWAFVVSPKFITPATTSFTGSYDAKLKGVTFDWNTGVRAGISYVLPRDSWDTRFYYTWYHTSGANHLSPSTDYVIQSQFIATDFLLSLPTFSSSFHEAKIKWNVLFNMFNWDIGRICWIGNFLSLRPHLGIQGGWIYQNIHVDWINSATIIPYNAKETLKHRFWGVGPEAGVNSKWYLHKFTNHALSIYGDFSQVFMWGHWSFNEKAQTTINVTTVNTQPNREMGSLTFVGATGFAWEYHHSKTSAAFTLKLGYEWQVWMQQLQFFQHFSGILSNALTLQGATCRLQLAF